MNKTFNEFKSLDCNEMEKFFLKASYYFYDNSEDMPNLPAEKIAKCLSECYSLMKQRAGN